MLGARLLTLLAGAALLVAACDEDPPLEGDAATPPAATSPATTDPGATATATAPPIEPTASTGGLAIEELPVIEFTRGDGSIVELPVEVPPREDYGIGLSGRYQLDERGMLFHYADEERARGFYMRNTHIALDIAFVGADFALIEIRTMVADTLDIVRPDRGFMYAVEAPAGWYAAAGIEAGDHMRLTFELPEG